MQSMLLLLLLLLLCAAAEAPRLHLDGGARCAEPPTARRANNFSYTPTEAMALWRLEANRSLTTVCVPMRWNYSAWLAPWRSASLVCNRNDGSTSVEFFPTADCLNANPMDMPGVFAAELLAAVEGVEDGLPGRNVTEVASALVFTSGFPLPTSRLATRAANGTCFETSATLDDAALSVAFRSAFNLQAGHSPGRPAEEMGVVERALLNNQLHTYPHTH